MDNDKRYWFPAKPYGSGVGWGLPLTWQGWIVFVSYFALILADAIFLAPRNGIAFFIAGAFLSLGFVTICILKGEPQHKRGTLPDQIK
ncbi:MAG: uncharacterized protein JWQ01_2079 [Massilia sp.]|jgi:hypothetical protein|nr:uncharacterized protein [Massilia sp.]